MQFQVPQFIEVEDKIFGPLTFRQFVFLAGGVGGAYVCWRVLPFILSIPLVAGVVGLAVALAFFKWNGQPFIVALEHGFFYLMHPKLYLWNNAKKPQAAVAKDDSGTSPGEVYVPKLSDSKLHDLAWSLDIQERIAQGIADRREVEGSSAAEPALMHTAREALPQR